MENKVTIFKLTSAEEVVAEVIKENDTIVTVRNPMTSVLTQTAPGQVGVALIPWVSSWGAGLEGDVVIAPTFDIQRSQIMAVPTTDIPSGVQKMYLERTTKIQLV